MVYYIKPLEYWFADGTHEVFSKYTIDTLGVIRNVITNKPRDYTLNKTGYHTCTLHRDVGKKRGILVGRAIASTFLGKPPNPSHTTDHINSLEKTNDCLDNIKWSCKKEQRSNQVRPDSHNSAYIVVKDNIEKTVKEWETSTGIKARTIASYAANNTNGFSYKVYDDLPGEIWKKIEGSENKRGEWWLSNKCRAKYKTSKTSNVIDIFHPVSGYPSIKINNKTKLLHHLSLQVFFPDEYSKFVSGETMILHKDDDRMNFTPENLYVGTCQENCKSAHDNDRYYGKKSARMKCVSFLNGIKEKEYISLGEAEEYLKSIGYTKASQKNIGDAVKFSMSDKIIKRYGRTWEVLD